MKYSKLIGLILLLIFVFSFKTNAQVSKSQLRQPVELQYVEEHLPTKIDLHEIPSFSNPFRKLKNNYRIGLDQSSVTVPLNTRLRIKVDQYLDPKSTNVGDYFKAHIIEDFYFPSNPEWLLLPQGSWVRGTVSYVKRPNLFTRKGYIRIRIDQITTPLGDIIPLSAELNVQEGIINAGGGLDPFVNEKIVKGDQIVEEIQTVVILFSEVDSKIVNKFLDGSLIALYFPASGDILNSGKELQIVLKKNIQFVQNN